MAWHSDTGGTADDSEDWPKYWEASGTCWQALEGGWAGWTQADKASEDLVNEMAAVLAGEVYEAEEGDDRAEEPEMDPRANFPPKAKAQCDISIVKSG